MTENELLLKISNIMEEKLKESISPLAADIKSLKADVNTLKSDVDTLKADVNLLKADMKVVKIDLLENNVLPRLSNIEQHYVATSDRYMDATESIESLKKDMDVVKLVVTKHSEKLQRIS